MSGTRTRVYVVDDESLLRASLLQLLERAGYRVLTFASGDAFLAAYPKLSPGCIILDVVMQGMSGLELQRRLITAGCKWPVIVLTAHADHAIAERAVEIGAVAFLIKPVRHVELLAALLKGESYLLGAADAIPDPEVVRRVARLTPRERDVLRGILDAMINKEMAAQFGISESAVKGYRRIVMTKLGARTPAELVMLAIRAGFTGKRLE
jgi:two-component system, LuxR family, response regulator FixJ